MKKNFKTFAASVICALVLFNIIAFVVPDSVSDNKFTSSYWVGYIAITIAFIVQLITGHLAFNADTQNKKFYNISLLQVSFTGLIGILVTGLFFMFAGFSYWIAVIVCFGILAVEIISILCASAAADAVSNIDNKVKSSTQFIKLLSADAKSLIDVSNSDEIKKECTKVYEAIRYSDPVSNNSLFSIENSIKNNFTEFSEAVKTNNAEKAKEYSDKLITDINERNNKTKIMK